MRTLKLNQIDIQTPIGVFNLQDVLFSLDDSKLQEKAEQFDDVDELAQQIELGSTGYTWANYFEDSASDKAIHSLCESIKTLEVYPLEEEARILDYQKKVKEIKNNLTINTLRDLCQRWSIELTVITLDNLEWTAKNDETKEGDLDDFLLELNEDQTTQIYAVCSGNYAKSLSNKRLMDEISELKRSLKISQSAYNAAIKAIERNTKTLDHATALLNETKELVTA